MVLGGWVVLRVAIYGQCIKQGMDSISWALIAMALGALLCFPIRKWIKPGVPDIDPLVADEAAS